MTSARAETIPRKTCRPERRLTCSHDALRSLRRHGVTVFECAHHWVDDRSIAFEVAYGKDHDLYCPHGDKTNRAGRIATIVRAMQRGVVFDPLFMRVVEEDGRIVELHLADGHHRLRALEWNSVFGGGSQAARFNVGGKIAAVDLLRSMLAG